tara:strand:+ start:1599 stop:2588 length:990 start_codon:yes stop_codon:yes gene_type:complete
MSNLVLVTGADGFIGSHLVEYLVSAGYKVRAFCFYNSFNSWGWLDVLPKNIMEQVEVFTGDVRDPNGVRVAMQGVEVVYHLAALIAIPFSYHSPDSYIDTNVKGTLNVLQAARDAEVSRILVTSTSEVYGTAQFVPITETHPKQAQSPYAASKIAADAIAESFCKSFSLPVSIVRPFNTYGPRQSARAFIPTIITQLLSGLKQIKLGDLTPTRDLLYVDDTVKGFEAVALTNQLIGHEVNLATKSEISVGDVAQKLIKLINSDASIILDTDRLRPKNSEVFRLFGDNEKMALHTEWKPTYSLEEGLAKTVKWFSNPENISQYKTEIYNI